MGTGRRRILISLLAIGLLLIACTSAPPVPTAVAPWADFAADADHAEHHGSTLTVNVYVTDAGFEPASIAIPAGRAVELVLRNVGADEHHLKVAGLAATGLMRLSRVEVVAAVDGNHAHDHGGSLVPIGSSTSSAGIRRSGNEVHAYAFGGGMDVIVFTATKSGAFKMHCPLHPGLTGRVEVY